MRGIQVIPSDRIGERLSDLIKNNNMYGLVDAAGGDKARSFLGRVNANAQCLYDGESAEVMKDHAPYLVDFRTHPVFLDDFVASCWGNSIGYLVMSDFEMRDLKKHFRKFVYVGLPDGKMAFFRFYDPRVLRAFLLGGSTEHFRQFFSGLTGIAFEAENRRDMNIYWPEG